MGVCAFGDRRHDGDAGALLPGKVRPAVIPAEAGTHAGQMNWNHELLGSFVLIAVGG